MLDTGSATADTDRLFPGKPFISSTLAALDVKASMSRHVSVRYLQRAGIAGLLIGVFYLTYYLTVTIFAQFRIGDADLAGVGKFIGAMLFGWALVFIYFTKSELLTSNMMLASIGLYYRKLSLRGAGRLLGLCYLGNLLGGAVLALLLAASSLGNGAVLEQMQHSVAIKLGYLTAGPIGWSDLFVRAVLCNLMINAAMLVAYNGFIRDDLTKSLAMVISVFVFVYLGLEHSVANTVLFTMVGTKAGIDLGLAAANVAIALAGNMLGGGVLIGLYYAYLNDDVRALRGRT